MWKPGTPCGFLPILKPHIPCYAQQFELEIDATTSQQTPFPIKNQPSHVQILHVQERRMPKQELPVQPQVPKLQLDKNA